MKRWIEKVPLPGTNGERILKYCRDNDGYFVCQREGDRISCRLLNQDGYLVRDHYDSGKWYWTILARDTLEQMEARRMRLAIDTVPSLASPEPKERKVILAKPKAAQKARVSPKVRGKIAYSGQDDAGVMLVDVVDSTFIRRFVL